MAEEKNNNLGFPPKDGDNGIYRAIFDNAVEMIVLLDPSNFHPIEVNAATLQFLGYTKEEYLNLRADDISADEPEFSLKEALIKIRGALVEPHFFDWLCKKKNGELFWVEVQMKKINHDNNDYLLAISREITERKTNEARLAESEDKFKAIAESAEDYIYTKDSERRYTYVNPAMAKLFRKMPDEIIGKVPVDLLGEEAAKKVKAADDEVFSGKTVSEIQPRIIDGEELIYHAVLTPVKNSEGEVASMCGIVRDVTDQARSEEEVQKFKTMIDIANYGAAILNRELEIIYCNNSFAEMHGYQAEDLIGKRASVFHNDRQWPIAHNQILRLIEKGSMHAIEVFHTRRNGSEFPMLMSGAVIYDNAGRPKYISTTAIDITEIKLTEKRLKESEEKYRLVAENAKDIIWVRDLNLKRTYVSPAVKSMLGFTPEEDMDRPLDQSMTPSSLSLVMKSVQEAFKRVGNGEHPSEIHYSIELALTKKDRSTIWTESTLSFISDSDGRPAGILGVTRDISGRRAAEEKLQQSERKFRAIIENSQPVIFMIDRDGIFQLSEGRSLEMLGLIPGQVVGSHISELFADSPEIINLINRSLAGELIREVAVFGGSYFDTSYTPILSAAGEVENIIGMAIDITDSRNSHEKLQLAHAELQELDEMKNNFLSNISHELRTPMVAIKGYIDLVINNATDLRTAREWLEVAAHNLNRLDAMITDLLDISLVEQKKQTYTPEEFDLVDLIHDLIKAFRPKFEMKDISINLRQVDVPVTLNADKKSINSLIGNLINNAIKFSPDSSKIDITVGPGGVDYVEVQIADEGIGVPEKFREKIFNKFFQIDSGVTRRYGGAGIGLALAREIVEGHGGNIRCESNSPSGSIFIFTLSRLHN